MTDTTSLPIVAKPPRKGLLAAVIAVPLVLLGGGAFAVQQLSGGGTQPDEVMPANVMAYARLDTDPSASQKIKLFKLIKKSPAAAKELGIKTDKQDLRKDIANDILGGDCKSVDYDRDIKPWLGDRIGAAVDPDMSVLVAVQVTDEKAARKGIKLATSCQNLDNPGIAFAKGYALVAETQKVADAAAKYAVDKPLSAKPAFTEDMQSLGDPGLSSLWIDAQTYSKTMADEFPAAAQANKALEATRSIAVSLRAGDDNIEVTGIEHSLKDLGKVATVDLGGLPSKSVFAASFAGGGDRVDEQWLSSTQGFAKDEIDSSVKEIEAQTGFVLPQDLKTLLGDNITLVVGDSNLEVFESAESPEDLAKLDIAIAMHSDRAAATTLARKIAAAASEFGGVDLAVLSTKDGAVLANNKAFAADFGKGKKLTDSSAFRSVVNDDKSAHGGFFLDIAKVVDAVRAMNPSASDKKELEQIKDLNAFGFSATKVGPRVMRGTLKLSFSD